MEGQYSSLQFLFLERNGEIFWVFGKKFWANILPRNYNWSTRQQRWTEMANKKFWRSLKRTQNFKKRMETKEGKFKNLKSLKGWKNQNFKNCIQRNSHEGVHRRVEKFKKTRDQKSFNKLQNLIKKQTEKRKDQTTKIKFRTRSSIWKVKTKEQI
jgi:hypothetical protein